MNTADNRSPCTCVGCLIMIARVVLELLCLYGIIWLVQNVLR